MMKYMLPVVLLLGCPGSTKESVDSGTDGVGDSGDSVGDTGGTGETGETGGDDTGRPDSGDDTGDTGGETGDTGGETGDTGGETGDTGGETGDTGGDTGDTGGETGDTGGDTGDTGGGSACTASDLLWEAEVRDSAGVAGVLFGPRDDLTMAAVVRNPCANDIVFQTPDTCLTNSWSVTDSSGMGMGVAVACAPAVTRWTVPAGGTLEETQPWGRLRVERYVLDIQFNFRMGIGAQENFEVQ